MNEESNRQTDKPLNRLSWWIRIVLSLGAAILYALAFLLMYPSAGAAGSALIVLPVVVAGWFLGLRGGILAGVLGVFLNVLLFYMVGENGFEVVLQGGLAGASSMLVIGAVVGWLSSLLTKVQEQSHQLAVAHKQLHKYTAELEASNAELDAFTYTVAHDLKTPLTALIGYSNLLETGLVNMSEQERDNYLHIITQNGRKMTNIIEELLLLAHVRKIEEVSVTPLDMGRIIAETTDRLAYLIEGHQAKVTMPETWPVALGHGPWIEEVWTNYLSNALKYGGRPPQVELGATTQEDGMVRFWVRDNGAGIAPEDHDTLFVPFTRLDQVHIEGQGLGLSIVQRIVEKLNGRVGLESEVGQGSTFWFDLPGV